MRPQSAKAKGRRLQQWMCKEIIQKLSVVPEDCRSCSMGAGGEDIKLSAAARAKFPYSVECKNRENINVWKAYQQCEANAPIGARPLVCIKRNGTVPLVVVDAAHFVDLVARTHDTPPPPAPPSSPIQTAQLEDIIYDPRMSVVLSETCVLRAQTP